MAQTELYSIDAKLYTKDDVLDVSENIRQFKVLQSISNPVTLYTIEISNRFSSYFSKDVLDKLEIVVQYKDPKNQEMLRYAFTGIPISLSANLFMDSNILQQTPDISFTPYYLIEKQIYDLYMKEINVNKFENITVDSIVKNYYSNVVIDGNINTENIEQVFIPSQHHFDSLLKYLQYWFGFFSGTTIFQYRYDAQKEDLELRIRDLNYLFKLEKYDATLYAVNSDDDVNSIIENELTDDNYVYSIIPGPWSSELHRYIHFDKLIFIEKPINNLFKKYEYEIDKFINDYSLTFNEVKKDDFKQVTKNTVVVRNHTGFKDYPITSMFSDEFKSATTYEFFTKDKKLFVAYPGDVVTLNISNPDLQEYSGLYYVDVLESTFYFKDANWKNLTRYVLSRSL